RQHLVGDEEEQRVPPLADRADRQRVRGGEREHKHHDGGADRRDRRVLDVRVHAVEDQPELAEGRAEGELGRPGLRGGLRLERRDHHPQHRDEEADAHHPAEHRPARQAGHLAGTAAALRRGRRRGRRVGYRYRGHFASSNWKTLANSRSAKLATMSVRMTVTTPAAAAPPRSKAKVTFWV